MNRRTLAGAGACLGVLLAARLWVLEPVMVSSDSMEPTVKAGSLVWLNKAAPRFGGFHTGQLVMFSGPDDDQVFNESMLLKRVVALEGQEVSMRDGVLFVDGAPVTERFVDQRTIDGVFFGTLTVPADHLFVLGDNRETSIDSRHIGAIPASDVLGTVVGAG
ncbi:Signal peptidase I V [compost metagenome]